MLAGKREIHRYIQEATMSGSAIVEFMVALASGQPFLLKRTVPLPLTAEQYAVDRGTATPEQRKIANEQPGSTVVEWLHYPTLEEMKEAVCWLTDRGFGKAPQTVQVEGSQTSGFKIILRHWPLGTDPAELPGEQLPKNVVSGSVRPKDSGIASARAQQEPGQNSTNGHKDGNGAGR